MRNRTALVLGATGGIGGTVARCLEQRGWSIRALHRSPEQIGQRDAFEWVRGDAMSEADVTAAAAGTSLIVHAVNPPGYRHWGKLVLPMLENTIAAASQHGACVLLPGTIYNYGPDAFPVLHEESPQQPVTVKGRIRVEMENRLHAAAEAGAIKALIVRSGDFFGPRAGANWLSQVLVKAGRRPTSVCYPGSPGVGHAWAYLPDVAETMVRLVEREDLDPFAKFHMEGHWDDDGIRMISAIRRLLGSPDLPVRRFPWKMLGLASPFVPFFRELREMRYLWEQSIRLDNGALLAAIGEEPRTPLDEAVRATLLDLGCLSEAA